MYCLADIPAISPSPTVPGGPPIPRIFGANPKPQPRPFLEGICRDFWYKLAPWWFISGKPVITWGNRTKCFHIKKGPFFASIL